MLTKGRPSASDIYSARSTSANRQVIYAMRDCYLDELSTGNSSRGDIVFRLNTFEIDRETFKLMQEKTLLKITEHRLEEDYLQDLIFAPLSAAVQLAEADIIAAEEELAAFTSKAEVGQDTYTSVMLAQARLDECKIIREKARTELGQKRLDVEVMRRKFSAEESDLDQRLQMNLNIRALHQFVMPFDGAVESHSYVGSFLEEGDPICTVLVTDPTIHERQRVLG